MTIDLADSLMVLVDLQGVGVQTVVKEIIAVADEAVTAKFIVFLRGLQNWASGGSFGKSRSLASLGEKETRI